MKTNRSIFVFLFTALLSISACGSDDEGSGTDGYKCMISFMQADDVSVKIIETPSNFDPNTTSASGVPAPGKADVLYFKANELGGEEPLVRKWKNRETVSLRITSYELIDDEYIHQMTTGGNSSQKDYKEYWCTVAPCQ
jgi:hypothetical protein